MRRSLGISVFSGMLGVTAFGIFLTPVFFDLIQRGVDAQFFIGRTKRYILTAALGGLLGAASGFLISRIGVGNMPLPPIIGAGVGIAVCTTVHIVWHWVSPLLRTKGTS